MAEPINQPALRHNLHPGADAGSTGTEPHEAEIAILEGFEDSTDHGWLPKGISAAYHETALDHGC